MKKAKKSLLAETFEVKGKWFLPGKDMEQDGVAGILHYSPEDIDLDLIGTLEDPVDVQFEGSQPYSTIYGYSEFGEYITLVNCVPRRARMNAPGFDTVTYRVNRFYVGTRLVEDEDAALPISTEFSFVNLDAWLDYNIVSYRHNKEMGKLECVIDLGASSSKRKQLHIPAIGMVLNEEGRYKLEYPKDFFLGERTEIFVHRFYRMVGSDSQVTSFHHLRDQLNQFRRLLTLIIGKAMYFSYIDFAETEYRYRLFYNQVGDLNRILHLSPYKPKSILISRKDIEDNMAIIINNWFEQQEQLGEIINPYISNLYLPTYEENKFLNIVRGLETFHRYYGGEVSDETSNDSLAVERNKLLTYIRAEIAEDVQEYFISRVNYEEDKSSLRNRLNCLFTIAPAELTRRILKESHISGKRHLISAIVDTRNYYTHRDSKSKYPLVIEDTLDLNKVSRGLEMLLQFFCLTQIGIEPKVVVKRLLAHS